MNSKFLPSVNSKFLPWITPHGWCSQSGSMTCLKMSSKQEKRNVEWENLKVPRCTLCRKKIPNENVESGFPGCLVFRSTELIKKCIKMENHFGRNHLLRQQPITLLICVAQTEIELVERVARVPSISYQSNLLSPKLWCQTWVHVILFFCVTPNMGACHTLALYTL